MAKQKTNMNNEVTKFVDDLNHPFRKEIEQLRLNILNANNGLTENIKWNGPNYCFANEDRITMRIQPITTKQIQVIFHRGAKVQALPKTNLIADDTKILTWKTTDRAVATFTNSADIKAKSADVTDLVTKWLKATT